MRKIDLIVIHCSATRENTDYSPKQLESDHKARGFLRAGYNFYIRKSGVYPSARMATSMHLAVLPLCSRYLCGVMWAVPF